MARYNYTALDMAGKKNKGIIHAGDEAEAYKAIRGLGMFATDISEVKGKEVTKALKSKHLASYTRELSTMLESGIALVQAINIIAQRETNGTLATIYTNLYNQITSGVVLSEAMEDMGGVFPELLINMARSGEEGGQLPKAMKDMADYYEKDNKLRRKIMGALMYPAFLLGLVIVAVVIIFTVVLPTFFELFDSMEVLPWNTRLLIWMSNALRNNMLGCLICIVLIVLAINQISKIDTVKMFFEKLKIHLPIAGKLFKVIYTSRFARALSSLYANGVPLVTAVGSASRIIGNRYVEEQFKQVIEDMCNGILLSVAISEVDGFDRKLSASIYIGEEAGKLNTMLDSIADSFESEADEATKKLTTLIEPIMIVIMAVIVGFIIISVIVPIYQYYNSIG